MDRCELDDLIEEMSQFDMENFDSFSEISREIGMEISTALGTVIFQMQQLRELLPEEED